MRERKVPSFRDMDEAVRISYLSQLRQEMKTFMPEKQKILNLLFDYAEKKLVGKPLFHRLASIAPARLKRYKVVEDIIGSRYLPLLPFLDKSRTILQDILEENSELRLVVLPKVVDLYKEQIAQQSIYFGMNCFVAALAYACVFGLDVTAVALFAMSFSCKYISDFRLKLSLDLHDDVYASGYENYYFGDPTELGLSVIRSTGETISGAGYRLFSSQSPAEDPDTLSDQGQLALAFGNS